MNIWMVSREYAGIAEAGGVKNVACSLSEELVSLKNDVTLFIPNYGCTSMQNIKEYAEYKSETVEINICGKLEKVFYNTGLCNGVNIVFVNHKCFSKKRNVYTYSIQEQNIEKGQYCGTGYKDNQFMNILFQKSILSYHKVSSIPCPKIIHCHDACTASLPAMLASEKDTFFKNTKCFVTIHNAGPAYHHEFANFDEAKWYTSIDDNLLGQALNCNRIEPYLLAAASNATLTTVSPFYAEELLNPENQDTEGLSKIFFTKKIPIIGITNGIDISRYSPENKSISLLPFEFSPSSGNLLGKYKCREYFLEKTASESFENPNITQYGFLDSEGRVFVAFHARIVQQKGIIVLMDSIRTLLAKCEYVRFVINGQGEISLENKLIAMADEFPGKLVFFKGYDKALSRLFMAISDFAVMPSSFEPCGLEDFIAQTYGTIPVAHATGGLKKIIDGKTGFTYEPNTENALTAKLFPLVQNVNGNPECYKEIIQFGAKYVKDNFSWENVVKNQYISLYTS